MMIASFLAHNFPGSLTSQPEDRRYLTLLHVNVMFKCADDYQKSCPFRASVCKVVLSHVLNTSLPPDQGNKNGPLGFNALCQIPPFQSEIPAVTYVVL